MADKETQNGSDKQEKTVAKSTPKASARKERAFYYPEYEVTVLAKDRKEADNKLKEQLKDKDQK